MIAFGLNASGASEALDMNPRNDSPFDPTVAPGRVVADPAGIVRVRADGAAVTQLLAEPVGIVQTHAIGTES